MQIGQLSPNILKILSGEGSSSLPRQFIQQLNIGQFLKGQVIQIFSEGKSLLHFGGQKIIVEGNPSFKTGQTLTAQVEKLTPVPVLKIVNTSTPAKPADQGPAANDIAGKGLKTEVTLQLSSRTSSPISFFSQTNLEFLKLSRGKVYRAQVKQVLDPETAVIQLKSRNFFVQTDASKPLKPGNQIPVIAERTANESFHILQSSGPVISRVNPGMIKPYLPVREPFGQMITKLTTIVRELLSAPEFSKVEGKEIMAKMDQTLQLLTSGTEKAPSAKMVREQVNLSGIDYEAKVKQFLEKGSSPGKGMEINRDLKGQLLEIIQKLENQNSQKGFSSSQSQTVKDYIQIFSQAADNIELHQLTNQLVKQEGQSLLLQIPNPFAHGDPTIKLYVRSTEDEEQGKKGKSRGNFNLVFLLDLSNLGNLRVDSQIAQTRLSIKMTVENQSIADFIVSQAQDFESQLAGLGFQADLTCCVQDKINMDPDNDLRGILTKNESRLVDVTT